MSRRFGRALPSILLLGLGLFIARGLFTEPSEFRWYTFAASALLVLMLLGTSISRLRRGPEKSLARDAEFSVTLVLVGFAVVSMTGRFESPLYPAVYLTLAALVRFHRPSVALAAVLAALAMEGASFALQVDYRARPDVLVAHLSFFVVFSTLFAVLRRLGAAAAMRRELGAEKAEVRAAYQRARDYGLLASGNLRRLREHRQEEELDALVAADRAVGATRRHLLEVLKQATGARAAVLSWLDEEGRTFRVHDVAAAPGAPRPGDAASGAGVLGSLLKGGGTIVLQDLRSDYLGVAYYEDGGGVTAFLGASVIKDGKTVGALCLDRSDGKPFDEGFRPLLEEAAEQCLRMVEDERSLLTLGREQEELRRFYEASRTLNSALTITDVHQRTCEALERIASPDLLVFTAREERPVRGEGRSVEVRHRVTFARGERIRDLEDLEFDDTGAVGLVCRRGVMFHKNLSVMRRDGAPMGIFGERELRGIDSLLILPLVAQDKVAGTLVVGAREADVFGDEVVRIVAVVANHVAVSLLNAELYARMERMAITDGLTGLYNHRYFQERLDDFIARSERHGQTFSVLLSDIDHFKKVNDTHGHPVGDKVLRRFSQLLDDSARKVDLVSRYGGEEFVLVLDGTEREGAVQFAERVREEIARLVFGGSEGTFSVTVSIGISTYPEDAAEKAELVDRADQALYFSKENGRNRTTTWPQAKANRKTG